MFAPPGAPDVLTLAQTAYRIYDAYHGAQDRYKELCDDIRGLEITLQRLGNRLATHPSTDPVSDNTAGGGYNEAKLEEIVHVATTLLEELQRKIPAGTVPRGLYRLKWSQNEANAFRTRITGISAMIAAFNSSLLLDYVDSSTTQLGETQEKILRTLEDVLISLQSETKTKLKRRDSETSTLVEIQTEIEQEQEGGRTDLWIDLVTEMQKHGISETQIEQHKGMILQWAGRAIAAGILNQPDDEETETETETYWEVISAVYGPRNVTSILQRMIDIHRQHQQHPRSRPLQFIIANEAFGGDPFPNHVKAFSMAWRKRVVRRYGRQTSTSYSAVQKVFAQEDDVVVIDFDQPFDLEESSVQSATRRGVEIVIASWHNLDMTQHITSLIQEGQTAIMATDMQLLTRDPSPGYIKFLSVTYTYTSARNNNNGHQYFQVNFAEEGTELDIPPSLDILYANWGGLDITATLQAKIDPNTQTLTLDTNRMSHIASPDPWPGFQKSIVVLYRYSTISKSIHEGDGMESLVVGEGMGTAAIKPYQCGAHRSQSWWSLDLPFPSDDEKRSKARILGIIWGLQPVSKTMWSLQKELRDSVLLSRRISCTNKVFGGDGWLNRVKVCLVLVQNVETREIAALVGRENTVLELVSPWQS